MLPELLILSAINTTLPPSVLTDEALIIPALLTLLFNKSELLAVILIFLPFIVISIGMGLAAVIFGIIAKNKGEKNLSKAGITLGIVSLGITLVLFLFLEVFEASLFVIPSWYK